MADVPAEASGNATPPSEPPSEKISDEQLHRMSRNVQRLKARGLLRMKEAVITRERARELALEVAEGRDVSDVVDLEELTATGVRTPCVYNVDASACWIAYLATQKPWALRASDIVLIEKATGAVRYIGAANDEG